MSIKLLTVTQADNDVANALKDFPRTVHVRFCPTAIAFCRSNEWQLGTIGVSYTSIYDTKTFSTIYFLSTELEQAVRAYTKNDVPILGEFEITLNEPK